MLLNKLICLFVLITITTLIEGQSRNITAHFIHFTHHGRFEVLPSRIHELNLNLPFVFLTHGFFANIQIDIFLVNLTRAYRDLNNSNVLFVDWSRSSFNNYADLVFNGVPRLGEIIGEFIMQLYENGVNVKDVHLVGQSLGAHASGHAGRYVAKNHPRSEKIKRITGLDPAGPLYWKILFVFDNPVSLRASDADFVDVTHTNGGFLGTTNRIGTVDFFINGGSHQEFCEKPDSLMIFLVDHICAHQFSSILFHLTVGSNKYKASRNAIACENIIVYGDQVDFNVTGVYYVNTDADFPFKTVC